MLGYFFYLQNTIFNMETIKSKYAQIDEEHRVIKLLKKAPCTNGFETTIEDVEIIINNGVLEIKGKLWDWGLVLDKTFISELKEKPIKAHTKLGYETISNFFKGIKTEYVNGWYLKEDMPEYKASMSNWAFYNRA